MASNETVLAHTSLLPIAGKAISAGEGVKFSIFTSSVAGQPFLVTDHRNKLLPWLKPVTPELYNAGVVTVELPVTTVHTPMPVPGSSP
jgi:hypothetical protein